MGAILHHLKPMVTNHKILSECPKLRADHLSFNSHSKMKIRLATQPFSHNVASSFKYAVKQGRLPNDPYRLIYHTFYFLDKLFDFLNSSISHQGGKPWKTALRPKYENMIFLESVAKMLERNEWYFLGRMYHPTDPSLPQMNNQVQCLKMLQQTIRGLIGVSFKLFTHHSFECIPLRRFTKDIIENFFAQLRASSEHLSTLHFRLKFRSSRILLVMHFLMSTQIVSLMMS